MVSRRPRLPAAVCAPVACTAQAGIIGSGGQHGLVFQAVDQLAQVIGPEADVGVHRVRTEERSTPGMPKRLATARAVVGISCIRPIAPALERASAENRLSWRTRPYTQASSRSSC